VLSVVPTGGLPVGQVMAQATVFCIRLYDCTFPERGVYFLELWYDDVWVVDQRLELSEREAP
jgi:hypothetical protein